MRSLADCDLRRVVATAGEVVEGVGHLDDPAGHRHLLAELAHLPVGRGLGLHVVGHGLEPLGVPDDAGPLVGDVALVARRGEHGGTVGDRLEERDLAQVVQQGGVLQVAQVAVGRCRARRPIRTLRSATRSAWPVRRVAAVLGEVRQGGDRLAVGHPVLHVAADGDVGDREREQGDRKGQQAQRRRHQGDHRAGGDDGEGQRRCLTELVAQCGEPRGALALGAHRRGQHELDRRCRSRRRPPCRSRPATVRRPGRPRRPTATRPSGAKPRASQAATATPTSRAAICSRPDRASAKTTHERGEDESGRDDEHDEAGGDVEGGFTVDPAEEDQGEGRGGRQGRGRPTARHPQPEELAHGDRDDEDARR